MTRMNNVMTVRLPKEDLDVVKHIALETKKDKSTTVRELVEMGKVYFAIVRYKEGKISLGKAAEIAGLSIGETIDLFASLGIKNNMTLEDYKQETKNVDDVWK